MRYLTLTAFGLLASGLSFSACSNDDDSDGEEGTGGGAVFKIGSGGMMSPDDPGPPGAGGEPDGGPRATGGAGGGGAGGTGGTSPPPGSCKDNCGGVSDEECFCDPECELYGDCCADFAAECKKTFDLPPGCVIDPYFLLLCDPVTNQGCVNDGEACDWAGGGMKCWPDGNTQNPGATCNANLNQFCVPGYTCDGATNQTPIGVCKKYCCSAQDCDGGACKPFDVQLGTLGVCGPPDGGTGAGGDAASD